MKKDRQIVIRINAKAPIELHQESGYLVSRIIKEEYWGYVLGVTEEDIPEPPVNPYDQKGNADHYKQTRLDAFTLLERTFGTEALMTYCEITALTYRIRMGYKEGQPLEQEVTKAKWYETQAKYLFEKMNRGEAIMVDNTKQERNDL